MNSPVVRSLLVALITLLLFPSLSCSALPTHLVPHRVASSSSHQQLVQPIFPRSTTTAAAAAAAREVAAERAALAASAAEDDPYAHASFADVIAQNIARHTPRLLAQERQTSTFSPLSAMSSSSPETMTALETNAQAYSSNPAQSSTSFYASLDLSDRPPSFPPVIDRFSYIHPPMDAQHAALLQQHAAAAAHVAPFQYKAIHPAAFAPGAAAFEKQRLAAFGAPTAAAVAVPATAYSFYRPGIPTRFPYPKPSEQLAASGVPAASPAEQPAASPPAPVPAPPATAPAAAGAPAAPAAAVAVAAVNQKGATSTQAPVSVPPQPISAAGPVPSSLLQVSTSSSSLSPSTPTRLPRSYTHRLSAADALFHPSPSLSPLSHTTSYLSPAPILGSSPSHLQRAYEAAFSAQLEKDRVSQHRQQWKQELATERNRPRQPEMQPLPDEKEEKRPESIPGVNEDAEIIEVDPRKAEEIGREPPALFVQTEEKIGGQVLQQQEGEQQLYHDLAFPLDPPHLPPELAAYPLSFHAPHPLSHSSRLATETSFLSLSSQTHTATHTHVPVPPPSPHARNREQAERRQRQKQKEKDEKEKRSGIKDERERKAWWQTAAGLEENRQRVLQERRSQLLDVQGKTKLETPSYELPIAGASPSSSPSSFSSPPSLSALELSFSDSPRFSARQGIDFGSLGKTVSQRAGGGGSSMVAGKIPPSLTSSAKGKLPAVNGAKSAQSASSSSSSRNTDPFQAQQAVGYTPPSYSPPGPPASVNLAANAISSATAGYYVVAPSPVLSRYQDIRRVGYNADGQPLYTATYPSPSASPQQALQPVLGNFQMPLPIEGAGVAQSVFNPFAPPATVSRTKMEAEQAKVRAAAGGRAAVVGGEVGGVPVTGASLSGTTIVNINPASPVVINSLPVAQAQNAGTVSSSSSSNNGIVASRAAATSALATALLNYRQANAAAAASDSSIQGPGQQQQGVATVNALPGMTPFGGGAGMLDGEAPPPFLKPPPLPPLMS